MIQLILFFKLLASLLSDPLIIDAFTKPQSVKENGNITLKCKVIGHPRAEIEWQFEGTKLGLIVEAPMNVPVPAH